MDSTGNYLEIGKAFRTRCFALTSRASVESWRCGISSSREWGFIIFGRNGERETEKGLIVAALNSIKERSSGELPLENRIYISLVYDRAVKLSVKHSICGKLLHIRESGRGPAS